ncbi:MAG: DUF805 domain-containing protein [Bacteroidota bacterium]
MNYYIDVWKKYGQFYGRARRAEYWYFILFNALAMTALVMLDLFLIEGVGIEFPVLTVAYILASIIPNLAVTTRRLHDTGKSGWMMLISLIPFGNIVLLVFMCMDSEPGENIYGPNPKESYGEIIDEIGNIDHFRQV